MRHAEAQELECDVSRAMQAEAFTFHFQPIVDLEVGRVQKFEMLIRWAHPTRGMVPPDRFLPIIDRLGLTDALDRFVVRSAEAALARFDAVGLHEVGLSINLSPEALSSPAMTELLVWLAECGRMRASRITLEILESTALTMSEDALPIRLLTELRDAGFQVFLDDFGMGYAGLAHLATIPSTGLKIDRGLTSLVDRDPTSRAIVIALIRLAGELGLDAVVEGVENLAQIDIVRRAGCAVFQGFALSHPLPLDQAIVLAQNGFDASVSATG
jgi:EAL domain-containing protein (putative c-di-GMP-specific phosphodiesterase class I)